MLGLASSAILIIFKADTHTIIPLYAFGVFTAFTLSQSGMVVHWRKTQRARLAALSADQRVRWLRHRLVVAVIVGVTKFHARCLALDGDDGVCS